MSDWEGLNEAFAEIEGECTDAVRGISVEVWDGILRKTPQFHGSMAASWTYSLDHPVFENRSEQVLTKLDSGPVQPVYRGHPEALAIANAASLGADRGFTLGRHIWIANGVDHGEGPYSQKIEDGQVMLRKFNQPGRPVGRTLDQIQARYGDDVKPSQAARLKTLKVGD